MSIIEDIKKIEAEHFGAYILIFSAIISPGLLIIYLYLPEYFNSLNTLKLILFSASLSLPLAVINTFLSALVVPKSVTEFSDSMMLGALLSFLTLYASILASYLLALNFKWFVLVVFICEIVAVIGLIFLDKKYEHSP